MKNVVKGLRKKVITVLLVVGAVMMMTIGSVSAKALPKDKGRIVLEGQVIRTSLEGLMKLQKLKKLPSPSSLYYMYYKDTVFHVIKLKKARKIKLWDDGGGYYKQKAKLINVTGLQGIENYAGKKIVFSIHKNTTTWPSQASMPLGEPGSSEIRIYDKKTKSWTELRYLSNG